MAFCWVQDAELMFHSLTLTNVILIHLLFIYLFIQSFMNVYATMFFALCKQVMVLVAHANS